MADERIQYNEEMVGAGHPAKADTLNRLALIEHNTDGTHDRITKIKDPWVDARAFGALGDGVTDDTAAIQAAVDYAASLPVPGTVDFGGRPYLCTEVVMKPGLTLRNGQLNGSVRIGDPAGARVDFKNPTIENIRFHRPSLSAGTYGIKIANAHYFGTIRNCKFENIDMAIWQPQLAVSYSQNSHRGVIAGNFYSNVNYFIKGEKPTAATFGFADITVSENVGVARITHVMLEGIDGAVITNNTFFPYHTAANSEQSYGVFVDYGGWLIISNNQIFQPGYEGIYLSRCCSATVTGNNIAWAGSRAARSGIKFADGDFNGNVYVLSAVTGNHISFATRHSIEISGNCGYITISGNITRAEGSTQHYYGSENLSSMTHYGIGSEATTTDITAVGNQTSSALNSILGTRAYYANNFDNAANAQARVRVAAATGTETSMDVRGCESINLNQSAPTSITAFNNGYEGQTIYLTAFNSNSTIAHNSSIKLASGSNTNIAQYKTMMLRLTAGVWYQV